MRTLAVLVTLLIATPVLGGTAIVLSLLGFKDTPGSFLDMAPRWWARALLWAGGVRVVLHGEEWMNASEPHVYIANHVSWFDVLALAATLPHYRFVGKAELFRIPLFGQAARATGMIPIERENRKSAFESYKVAADQIRSGISVVVCPEGTRGQHYALRPFKKGPFVLAVAAGVPIVPTVVYGTIAILPRGSFWARSGDVHLHFHEPVAVTGKDYGDRDQLMVEVWERMAATLRDVYGIESHHTPISRGAPIAS